MTEAFVDRIVLGKFISCLTGKKQLILLFGELNCSFLDGYTVRVSSTGGGGGGGGGAGGKLPPQTV